MTQKENLPSACHKKDIYRLFSTFSDRMLREIMNEAIVELRSLTEKEAKLVRVLRKNEVAYVLDALGED